MPVCANCSKVDDPHLRCSSCHVSHYCSKECQMAAWRSHKSDCQSIKKQRKKLEENVKWLEFGIITGAKFSGKDIRVFYHTCEKEKLNGSEVFKVESQEYLARMESFVLAKHLTDIGFKEGNQAAISETLDIYATLIKKNSLMAEGIIQLSTILLFAAGRVQESYDLVKSCLIADSESNYRNITNFEIVLDDADILEDTLEEVDLALSGNTTINYGLWMSLIIIKWYILHGLERRLEGRRPIETVDSAAASKGQRFPEADVIFKERFDSLDLKDAVAKQKAILAKYGKLSNDVVGKAVRETVSSWVEWLSAKDSKVSYANAVKESSLDPWSKPRWYFFEAVKMGGVLNNVLIWLDSLKRS